MKLAPHRIKNLWFSFTLRDYERKKNSPIYRGGTSVSWKQRGMVYDRAMFGKVDHIHWYELRAKW